MHPETRLIMETKTQDLNAHPVTMPIYLSTTYHRAPDGSYADDYVYTRGDNPNRRLLEHSLANLEGGEVSYAFSSGMAAIHAVFASLQSGDHVVLPDDAYYNLRKLVERIFGRWGLTWSYVDMTDVNQIEKSIQSNTRLIWIETPSNPLLKVTDIRAVTELVRGRDILVGVDNTWTTPILQRPLDLGADIVMHSSTKYFGGHSDVLGGCIILKEAGTLSERISDVQHIAGGVPSPFDSWLVTRGLQTLTVRVKTQAETALQLARYLEDHPRIDKVHYPGLDSHAQHDVAAGQMINGFGAMLSVQVHGDRELAMTITNRLKLFVTATSLGGVESLVEHRRSVEGDDSQTPDNLLRVSVGLEHIDDLIEDWRQALM